MLHSLWVSLNVIDLYIEDIAVMKRACRSSMTTGHRLIFRINQTYKEYTYLHIDKNLLTVCVLKHT